MELLHTLTFSSPYLHLPRFFPKTRTPFSFIKTTHTPSHSYPRLSTRASLSTSPSLLTRPPEVPVPSNTRWIVVTEKPPVTGASKSDIVDYYVKSLARVVGCEREAQMCIYDASCESNFGFCCDIDEGLSLELSRIPGIVSVRPDNTPVDGKKDYSHPSLSLAGHSKMDLFTPKFSPLGKEYEYWIVRMEKSGVEMITKAQMVDYYAQILEKVLRNKQDAQASMYHISWQNELGFCCRIDEECAKELSDVPGVLSVRHDLSFESENKNYEGIPGIVSVRPDNTPAAGKMDYSHPSLSLADHSKLDILTPKFSPLGKDYEYWIVRMQKPGVETVTKAQMVDYYAQILEKVLRNKQDAQVSIYHISWQNELGFCCRIDEECAKELSDVPGVLSVRPDLSFESENKNYKGSFGPLESNGTHDSSEASLPDVKTKRLFVTGLSFYTSEKTLRAAFEGFGELVEVKVIMDKISKRSKGYAFIEYTTEAAAGAALKEMNGKIINGWMIIVDVARTNASGSFRIKEQNQTSTAPLNQVNRLG